MESALTGLGLSGSAGLNAYLPLLLMGIMGRLELLELEAPFDTLSSPPILLLLAILLCIEMTADKIPAIDSLNDGINTLIRPLAGALLFAASTSGLESTDPALLMGASLLTGSASAGGVHAVKASVRPGVTMTTGGAGNFFVSLVEDVVSFFVSILAILLPFLMIFFSMSVVALAGWWVWDLQRTRRYFPKEKAKRTDWEWNT